MSKRKKTLYGKTVLIFLIVLLLSYIITGVMIYYFLDEYLINYNVTQLSSAAEQIYVLSNNFIDQPLIYANLHKNVLESYITSYNKSSGAYVFIVDNYGKVLMSAPVINPYDNQDFERGINSGNMPNEIEDKLDNRYGYYYFNDKRQFNDVLDTDNVLVDQGSFYGLFEDTNQSWLTVCKRLSYVNDNGELVVYGSVVVSSPDPIVYNVRTVVIKYFMISMIITSIIALVVVSFYTSKITKPLKMLSESASKVSRGDFSNIVTIDSRDEIGDLVDSFNKMVADLESLDKVRNDFIANVSHDLRTPITTVRGFIEGILDGTIPPERQEHYLKIVKEEVVRMNALVNNLLEMTRLENSNIKERFKVFNVNELLRKTIANHENLITKKNINLIVDFEHEDLFVIGEHESIERVIVNLLHNAVKFTRVDGKIIVGSSKHKNKAQIYIKDNGIGIANEDLVYIWDRFYKTDKSRNVDKNGTGLGLAICKSIMNSHNQDIYVESELGKGSKFTFTLDLA